MSTHRTTGWPVRVMVVAAVAVVTVSAMAQAQSASPGPSPAASADVAVGWLGAGEEVYRDDFATPTGWTTIEDELGRSAYEDGGLSLQMTQDGSKVWDDHLLPESHAVLRVEALVSGLDGMGGAGVACGSSLGLQRYLFAAVNQEAEWVFGRMVDGRLQVIDRAPIPGDIDEHDVRVGIECASSPEEGGDHVLVTLDGRAMTLPAFDIPVGPYDKATLLVTADQAPVSVRFDDLMVHAGDVYARREQDRDPNKPST